jgi:probable F420-dependent oxidoreductase
MRPFRFMIASRDVVDARTLAERARWAESIGCSHVCIHDHLAPQFAPIPLLTAVAMATDRLRLCPLVLNNDLRHPAVLAQELATLDILSGGRLDVGIGAGWNAPEYEAIGLALDPPATRIERLGEAIAILRGLFGDAPFSFAGRHYTISAMDGQPKPIQRPHPPFLVGGTRERVLRLAAREGDIVGLDLRQDRESISDAFGPRMDVRVGWVRDEAGDRFERLDLSVLRVLGDISVGGKALAAAAEVVRRIDDRTGVAVRPDRLRDRPRRPAPPDPRALGHQLVPAGLVRRAGHPRHHPRRGAARGALEPVRHGNGRQAWPSRIASATMRTPRAAKATLISMSTCFVIRFVGRLWKTACSSSALSAG